MLCDSFLTKLITQLARENNVKTTLPKLAIVSLCEEVLRGARNKYRRVRLRKRESNGVSNRIN